MNNAVKWALGVGGLILIAITPYFWFTKPMLLWIACPLVIAWVVWLMIEYLRWAAKLGKK
jgi:hypothetical protein